jgi:DUF4097 and DUF4098 domain-containing protein YvlB
MKSRQMLALAIMLSGSGFAFAGTPINETRDFDLKGRVEISNVRGSVTVTTWDQARVAISGTLGSGSKGLSVTGDSSQLDIKVQGPENSGWFNWGSNSRMEDSNLDIKLPRNADIEINVVSAEVAVSGNAGQVLEVNSVSGRVRVDSQAKDLELSSVSGSIEITGSGERGEVETVSGDVNTRARLAVLKFETVSGNINIETDDYRELSTSSVSGDIRVRGKPRKDARVDAETMSGDVRLSFPADLSASIRAETFSGSIRSDFGSVKEPSRGPGRSLDVSVGGGDGRIKIETFSGDINLRHD